MTMAVRGLEDRVSEANTFYQHECELLGKCDVVVAEKIKGFAGFPFGLPDVYKKYEAGRRLAGEAKAPLRIP